MPIPMEPMDSIALDVFHYHSTSHDGEVYERLLLCVCRPSGYLIGIPIPKPRHEDKDEGLTRKRAAHLVLQRWADRFGAPREICSDRGPQFVSNISKPFVLRLVPAQLCVSRVDTKVMAKPKILASS